MNLSISQTISFHVVCHADDLRWSDENGPRFMSIQKRIVKGELVFYGKTSNPIEPTQNQCTMYFGGPFLFAMPNIVWQKPKIDKSPSGGYTHTYEFLSYAVPDAVMLNKQSYEDKNPVSEFLITSHMFPEE